MTATDPDDIRNEVHAGHDLESGLIERVREWVDVFGWIRLGRVLRIAGSPSMLVVTTLTLLIHLAGDRIIFGRELEPAIRTDPIFLIDHFSRLVPTSVFIDPRSSGFLVPLFAIAWSILVWVPAILMLTRQGALLTAGRTMMSTPDVVRHAKSRTVSGWLVAWVPMVCVAAIGIVILGIGGVSLWAGGVTALEPTLGIIAAIIAIPAGVLAFGGLVAVPMAWVAIANEANSDPLDALSRGYEFIYRRPLQLLMNLLAALIAWAVVVSLSIAIAIVTAVIAVGGIEWVGGTSSTMDGAVVVCRLIPAIVSITLAWGLIGGVYLLVRQSAGGQEPEDLWQPPMSPPPTMPKLRL